jgi:hypothetical protein
MVPPAGFFLEKPISPASVLWLANILIIRLAINPDPGLKNTSQSLLFRDFKRV